jgi:hypothetical protein
VFKGKLKPTVLNIEQARKRTSTICVRLQKRRIVAGVAQRLKHADCIVKRRSGPTGASASETAQGRVVRLCGASDLHRVGGPQLPQLIGSILVQCTQEGPGNPGNRSNELAGY